MLRRLALLLFVLCVLSLPMAPVHASPAAEAQGPRLATHMMTVSLLVASTQGGSGSEPIPASVAKAIQDIKDFLPYTRYEMHDTAVLRTASLNNLRTELQGPDARYTARFQYQMGDDGRLNIHKFELTRELEPGVSSSGRSKGEGATPQPSWRDVISTAFSVNVGETIVVGTSRLNGPGKALVLVLTVLPGQ